MTNPADESNELEGVESADEVCADIDAALPLEEEIPGDDEIKPIKKKILALEARHKIEDYEIEKQMREALDYLGGKKSSKKTIPESRQKSSSKSNHKKIPGKIKK